MRRLRLLAALLVTLFTASFTMDAAVELVRAEATHTQAPAQDQNTSPPCAGLCGCHIGCLKAELPQPSVQALASAAAPVFAPILAPASRAPEVSPPPPKQ